MLLQGTFGDERIICKNRFSPSTMWFLEIKLKFRLNSNSAKPAHQPWQPSLNLTLHSSSFLDQGIAGNLVFAPGVFSHGSKHWQWQQEI